MTFRYLGPDPVEVELVDVFAQLERGVPVDRVERRAVDLKEEAGRRRHGAVRPGEPRSEVAATHLAPEVACMANTAGGGALVVGIADDGTPLGTELDPEWLRHRLYELTGRQVTVDVRVADYRGTRILVLKVPEALEPVRHRNRILWRVDARCVEVDTASWWSGRLLRLGHDWSAEPSSFGLGDARPAAVQRARQFLRDSNETHATELARADDADLLRRLNVVTGDGALTNGGVILFIGLGDVAIDYIRRDTAGGDSSVRLRSPGRSLLEELHDVEQAVAAANATSRVATGLSIGQIRELPPRAVREAIVNGVVHRDWLSRAPTTVEHTGATLVVDSPGGFVGGVNPGNIITHPSEPRYRALAETMAALRVAEREGIGVDRMVVEMLRPGYRAPHLEQVDGPRVRAALVGGRVDEEWLRFLATVRPPSLADDLNALLVLRRLTEVGWADARRAAPSMQRPEVEALAVLERLEDAELDGGGALLTRVLGTPSGDPPAWRLSGAARARLRTRLAGLLGPGNRGRVATGWALARRRVSTTELSDLVGVSGNVAGGVLRALEADGVLHPSRGNRAGRSFHYVPAASSDGG